MKYIIGNKTKEQLVKEMESQGIKISNLAKELIDNVDFTPSKSREVEFKILKVSDLNISVEYPTLKQIYDKANEMGYDLCTHEEALNLRLSYKDQPNGEYLRIAMKSIADRGEGPSIFNLLRDDGGLWLNNNNGRLDYRYDSDYRFVFVPRKPLEIESLKTLEFSALCLSNSKDYILFGLTKDGQVYGRNKKKWVLLDNK